MDDKNYEKFKDLTYRDFRLLAKDDTLSKYEKIGFPNSYRKDREKQIFFDIKHKLKNLSKKNQIVFDIGSGCSDLAFMLIDHCHKNSHQLILIDSQEMLDQLPVKPFITAITILQEENFFRAWYVSGIGWTTLQESQYPTYIIRCADSENGICWESYNQVCISFREKDEFGFGRPWVIKEENGYKMWYSIRSRSSPYKIGYAESSDGIDWTRKDEEAGLNRSESGWDSEMICYPFLHSLFPENIRLFGAFLDNDIIAGVLIYETDMVAHAQYIASSEKGRQGGALDLLFFHLIRERYKDKSFFNFGISTESNGKYLNQGLIDFKEGFGGRAVMYDSYKINLIE